MLEPEALLLALQCLSATVYHEARGEPLEGQRLVAETVVNRANASGETLCEVVSAPGQYVSRGPINEEEAYQVAVSVALEVVVCGTETPVVSFHRVGTSVTWGEVHYYTTVGNHVFYSPN